MSSSTPHHVFVGVIARHTATVATMMTLQRVALEARDLGIRVSVMTEETGGIALARNLLCETFYDKTNGDSFLSMDDDVGRLKGADLARMVGHHVDVVGAPLPGRAIQPASVRRALDAGERMDSFLGIHENLSPLLMNFLEGRPRWVNPSLCEVESTSAGCLLISRRAMGKVIEKNGRFPYNDRNVPRVFEFTEQVPDDSYGFCKAWRSLGGQVFVDGMTTLSHRGVVDFTTKPLAALLGVA